MVIRLDSNRGWQTIARALAGSVLLASGLAACGPRPPADDAGSAPDSGSATDAAVAPDAGVHDAGPDASSLDAGSAEPRDLRVGAVRVVTTDGGRLDWGSNGLLAYDRRTRGVLYDVWVLDPAVPGATRCVTCDVEGLPVGHRGNPEWHPSGEWILFQAGVKVGNALVTHPGSGVANEIWAIRPDGTDPRELFDIADPNAFDGSLHPHFNHAGDEVVFSRFRRVPGIFEIHTLPFDTLDPRLGTPTEILPAGDTRWPDALYETHGYTPDDQHILFTGFTPATEQNNDILIADPVSRDLIDQVTATPDDWDEHAHFQPGTSRLLFSSSRDIPGGVGGITGLDSRADWWVRESDRTVRRLTRFADPSWSMRQATMSADGSPIEIPDTPLFAADGEFSSDGSAFAGVLLFRNLSADEWIVILELEEVVR